MEKLADNEIIKALECCNSTERGHCLNKCPYYNYSANCTRSMINDALDLINRKDAVIFNLNKEISALKLKNDEFLNLNEKAKAEIERLKHILVSFMSEVENWEHKYGVDTSNIPKIAVLGTEKENCIKQAKSEAYREFVMNVLRRIGFCELPNAVVRGHINKAYEELTRNLHGTCTETTDQTATNQSVSLIDGHIEG